MDKIAFEEDVLRVADKLDCFDHKEELEAWVVVEHPEVQKALVEAGFTHYQLVYGELVEL